LKRGVDARTGRLRSSFHKVRDPRFARRKVGVSGLPDTAPNAAFSGALARPFRALKSRPETGSNSMLKNTPDPERFLEALFDAETGRFEGRK